MNSAIVCSDAGRHGPDLAGDVETAGLRAIVASDCSEIARLMLINQADAVISYTTAPDDAFFAIFTTLGSLSPRPFIVFTPDSTAANAARAVEAGIHAYVMNGYNNRRIAPVLALAQARFDRDQFLRSQVRDLNQRLTEGPLLDRAKAILMGARQMREDEAFQTLHLAAMESRQRVGQVARTVIESAVYAEAVNRAGQLRMLSQRLVKLYALVCANVRAADARQQMRQSLDRVEDNLASLRRNLPPETFADLVEAVDVPWRNLADRLRAPAAIGCLAELDALAEEMLAQAVELVAALEVEHLARTLRIISLCGRQRMLSQRLAKEALLDSLLDRPRNSDQTETEFAAAMVQLGTVEFTTSGIAELLRGAGERWARYQDALQYAGSQAGRQAIAVLSEELLDQFEKLTGLYERGIQELIG